MAELTKKTFLDYAGLAKFWELIRVKFVAGVSVTADGATFTDIDGKTVATLGIASKDVATAGLMSQEQARLLDAVSGDIDAAVLINGIKIGEGQVTVDDNKLASLAIKYVSADESDDNKPYVVLYDPNDESGKAVSKFDATAFIQDAFLETADIVVNPEGQDAGTYLKLVFNLKDGSQSVSYVDVADMFVPYTVAEAGGLREENRVLSIKVAEGEKYLTTSASGLATTAQLTTDINAAATAAQQAAEKTAQDALDAALAVINNEETGILATAKKYTDGEISTLAGTVDGKLALKANAQDVSDALDLKADAADLENYYLKSETYSQAEVDAAIAAISGEGGALENYYTKAEVDGFVGGINDTIEENEKTTAEALTNLDTRVTANADAIAAINDAQTGIYATAVAEAARLAGVAESNANGYTDGEITELAGTVDGKLALKANAADVYTKTETYTKTEVDGKLADKANTTDVNGALALKANAADVYTKTETYTKTEVDGFISGVDTAAQGYAQAAYDAMVRIDETEIETLVG